MLTYRGTIYPWHCDHMGHMNVMWYVGKFDEATWQLFNVIGLTPGSLRAAGRGMAAVEQSVTYQQELHPGAVVSVSTVIDEIRERKIRFTHEMRNDETNDVVATTTLVAVHLDTVKRQACVFSPAVIAAAQALIAEAPRAN